jgi:hypothetical protein
MAGSCTNTCKHARTHAHAAEEQHGDRLHEKQGRRRGPARVDSRGGTGPGATEQPAGLAQAAAAVEGALVVHLLHRRALRRRSESVAGEFFAPPGRLARGPCALRHCNGSESGHMRNEATARPYSGGRHSKGGFKSRRLGGQGRDVRAMRHRSSLQVRAAHENGRQGSASRIS